MDIAYGSLHDARLPADAFDLATLWAVLEHVYDPRSLLREVHRVLRPGGTLVALVTNIRSIPGRFMRHDDVPRHTTMFSKKTLARMLGLTGFVPIDFFCNNDIFSGSVRGLFNIIVKRLLGEHIDDIIAQNRKAERWYEFSRQIRGRDSRLMEKIDRLDIAVTPLLDRLLNRLRCGFIMIVRARKP